MLSSKISIFIDDSSLSLCLSLLSSLVNHLYQNFLRILQPLIHRWIFALKITTKRQLLNLFLRRHKRHHPTPRTQYQLRRIREQHLNYLITQSKKNSLFRPFPFFEVRQIRDDARWFFVLFEFDGAEFLVAVEVGFEVLEEDDFFVEGLRVGEEVVLFDDVFG